ncbi:general secretion pathway protein GspB [Marinobacter pelagius]|uniref:General secretion pathway protein B n=1 Tax=Marinobacter pelagius TaxID=379482 RepID=A0A1I4SW68_9GAMM|nr:general secretion pathway protein GspB [Marinobacter pelagius]SFM68619.1 general secretion pathway protein B [Marinobacter pelagius]
MSYILDALRKSETERRQGKVPDLGQQVQLIHRPKKKRASSAVVWIALALLVNAAVLAVVFWPDKGLIVTPVEQEAPSRVNGEAVAEASREPPAEVPEPVNQASADERVAETGEAEDLERPEPQAVPAPQVSEKPTIIVPSVSASDGNPVLPAAESSGRVPHLVELPLSFQKSIPDLTFNSHLYSSDPSSSRVMINDNYLRAGDTFSGLTVERITEDGVILSRQGQSFRVGTVRDWVSPR